MTIFNSLPFTLTNGQTADATQVMANLNQIINNGNTGCAPIGGPFDFVSGTVMGAFIQSTAPVGWTQVNTYNDAVLRFVDNTGIGGATGGSWTIGGVTIGGTAITQANLPNCSFPTSNPPHNHGTSESPHVHTIDLNNAGSGGIAVQITGGPGSGSQTFTEGTVTGLSIVAATTTVSVTSGGSSSPHTHGFSNDATWRPSFVNSLVCSKN